MTAGVVTIGRKQYVCGLYWENSPSRSVSQVAKEAAKQPGNPADYYAVRAGNKQGRVPQFGLVAAALGVRSGLPSLAGCLANQQPGSWIGAFKFREGVAVVTIRDDLIVPDGDRFFMDEAEARDHLYQEMGIGGFQKIYAPESWGIPGGDTMPVTLLLNERTDVRIHAVALSKKAKTAMAIGFGLLATMLAVGWYIQMKQAEEEMLRAQQLAAVERMRIEAERIAGISKKVEYPPPERIWEKRPKPLDIVKACVKALEKVDATVAGWDITGYSCSGSSLQVRWARRGGFSKLPEGAEPSDTVSQATSSVSFEPLPVRGEELLLDPGKVVDRYLLQSWPGTLKKEPDPPPPPPPPGHKGEWNPPPPPWIKRSFTLTVPVLPWLLPDYLGDLPGVVIESMSSLGNGTGSNSSWKVEGAIYENRR